jgi:hypothetical protein
MSERKLRALVESLCFNKVRLLICLLHRRLEKEVKQERDAAASPACPKLSPKELRERELAELRRVGPGGLAHLNVFHTPEAARAVADFLNSQQDRAAEN